MSLDSQSSADSLRIQFPCHLKGTQDVTGLAFASPVPRDEQPEPPSPGRRWPLKGKRLTTFCASLCSYKMCSLCTP